MTSVPRVALLIESSRSYGRGIFRGIARYAHAHGPWSIFSRERECFTSMPAWLKHWRGDGVIARIDNPRMARNLLELKIPVVDVLGKAAYPNIPGFDTDADLVAKLAVDFYAKAGFQEIVYCGYRGLPFSDRREAALAARLSKIGRRLLVCSPKSGQIGSSHIQAIEEAGISAEKEIAKWLGLQNRPIALVACNDVRAQQVLNACREHGLHVPEDVAVMGVDNDNVLCPLCDPTLTSIQPDTERIGYEAAELLHKIMGGAVAEPGIRQIPPLKIVERASTDVSAVADSHVVQALRFIRNNLGNGIAVKDVLEAVGRSRTDLESRFLRHLKTSVRREILRQRMDRACNLLVQTDLRIEEIASLAGFNASTHFCRLFQNHFKTTPSLYRQANRVGRCYSITEG